MAAHLPYHRRRTGGRVVEGTALEMRRRCKPTVGSNPTLSANKKGALCPLFIGGSGVRWTTHCSTNRRQPIWGGAYAPIRAERGRKQLKAVFANPTPGFIASFRGF